MKEERMSSFQNARLKVTERHGKNGIRLVVRVVRQCSDSDGNISSADLLRSSLREVDIWIADDDYSDILLKSTSEGRLSADSFIKQFVGDLPSRRRNVVQVLWERLDAGRVGYVPADVLRRQYDVSRHPDVVSRRRNAEDVASTFYNDFSGSEVVSKEEVFAYFAGASLGTERHEDFELRVARSFNLDRPSHFRALAEGKSIDVTLGGSAKSTLGRAHPLYQTAAQQVGSTVADAPLTSAAFNRKGAFTKNAPPFVGATSLNTSITTTRV
jgi:hypothetical protein